MLKQTKPCQKCKEMVGWFEKRVQWGLQYHHPDGSDSHYVDTNGRGGARKYCYNCNCDITKCIEETDE